MALWSGTFLCARAALRSIVRSPLWCALPSAFPKASSALGKACSPSRGPDAVCGALCLPGKPLWSSASSCIVHSTFLGGRAVGLCYYWVFTYFSVRPQTSALLAGTWILIAVTILHERQTSVYQVLVIEGPGMPSQGACE